MRLIQEEQAHTRLDLLSVGNIKKKETEKETMEAVQDNQRFKDEARGRTSEAKSKIKQQGHVNDTSIQVALLYVPSSLFPSNLWSNLFGRSLLFKKEIHSPLVTRVTSFSSSSASSCPPTTPLNYIYRRNGLILCLHHSRQDYLTVSLTSRGWWWKTTDSKDWQRKRETDKRSCWRPLWPDHQWIQGH